MNRIGHRASVAIHAAGLSSHRKQVFAAFSTSVESSFSRRLSSPSSKVGLFESDSSRGYSSSAQSAWSPLLRPSDDNSIQVHESVQQALSEQRPVVALESTIVAHGLPYPENVELCRTLVQLFRDKGVEPATVAVQNGVCKIGLTWEELEDLAVAKQQNRVQKCSTRELSLFLAQHGRRKQGVSHTNYWGATTVASTMRLAHLAGIATFVTGGIGGVHRDGHVSMDVSADLHELARTPVVVVSAGIKSILDIPRTLEVLETNGVPVVSYRSNEFPAFFSPHSGVPASCRMEDADTIAAAYNVARDLNLPHGMLVGVPNMDPAGANVEEAIQRALQEASVDPSIAGQAVTPFILKRVSVLTGGDSLRSNLSLVRNNARVGADIAIAIAEQRRRSTANLTNCIAKPTSAIPHSRIVIMGGIVLDVIAKAALGCELVPKTSNRAVCSESDGGVARNVAESLGRLGSKPALYSAVGKDARGFALLDRLENECNMRDCRDTVRVVDNLNSATYLAILQADGDLHVACADTRVLDAIQPPPKEVLQHAAIFLMDANPPIEVLRETALLAITLDTKVYFEPTSFPKASDVGRDDKLMSCISVAFPNIGELSAMADGWLNTDEDLDTLLHDDAFAETRPLAQSVLERMHPDEAHLIVTVGAKGVFYASKIENNRFAFRHFPALECNVVQNSTGAGDSLCGAFIHAILEGKSMEVSSHA